MIVIVSEKAYMFSFWLASDYLIKLIHTSGNIWAANFQIAAGTFFGASGSPGAFNPAAFNTASSAIFSKFNNLVSGEYLAVKKTLRVSIDEGDGFPALVGLSSRNTVGPFLTDR